MKPADLSGQRFGRLTVMSQTQKPLFHTSGCRWWLCQCDCGKLIEVPTDCLRRGSTTSCGCRRDELSSIRMKKYNEKRRGNK